MVGRRKMKRKSVLGDRSDGPINVVDKSRERNDEWNCDEQRARKEQRRVKEKRVYQKPFWLLDDK